MSTLEQVPQWDDKTNIPEQTQEEKEKMEINNTSTFQEAIDAGKLDEAAAWLEDVKSEPKNNTRWLDHRSREIMRALCDVGRLNDAERYIDYAQNEEGRHGRKKKIEQLREQA